MQQAETIAGPYLDAALPFYDGKDVAHGRHHVLRLCERVLLLVPSDTDVDLPYLWFLVAFHGLVDALPEAGLAAETQALLERLGWDKSSAQEAIEGLRRHTTDPQRLEEKLVHDANLLEVLGAFGVAKAFTRGGAVGQTYDETLDIYEQNLAKAQFATEAGRKNAEAGRSYGRAFIRQLRAELEPSKLPNYMVE